MSEEIDLIVKEAYYRDVGRGVARINTGIMAKLDLKSGGIIEVKGRYNVPAIAWRGLPEDEFTDIIRIDPNIRDNAGVDIDDKVIIKKTEVKDAEKIAFAPTEPVRLMGGENYLKRLLEGRPVIKGQKIRVEVFGHTRTFQIIATKPSGIVKVTKDSDIELKEKPEGIEFPDSLSGVGGLKEVKNLIKELIELPLRYPEVYNKVDIRPTRGVLFYGPSGTGKTILAHAIINQMDGIHTIALSGSEIISQHQKPEKKLKEKFEEARDKAPSVIFINQIDSIARKRELSGELGRSVLAKLLTLIDNMPLGKVIVIAETNRPELIDELLLRPDRLEYHVYFPPPDKEARIEIFKIHLQGMSLDNNVDVDELAEKTENYTGEDIKAICRKASFSAIRRVLESEEHDEKSKDPELMKITMEDFEEAISVLRPSVREG
ncbi:MAG: AAA family ATPase [Bacteroidales bacterium]